jgi:rod shape-determining protein MreC
MLIRNGLSIAAWPLQMLIQAPSHVWQDTQSALATRDSLRQENETLKKTVSAEQLKLLEFDALQQENARLRTLLASRPADEPTAHAAKILQVQLDRLRQRVLIDQGAQDGVIRGQPVIDANGIVGQTTSVGPLTSEVILLSDPTHAIPVQIKRTGLRTVAVGTGSPYRLSLPYLPRNTDVETNDVLLSSGLGGIFPAGLPVGRITEVNHDPSQPLARVTAVPAAALDRAQEVLLLTSVPRPEAPPPATADNPTRTDATPKKR